ncbi:MAG: 30S ribosomal protein S7 [Deltaproteobacteria bacterium HGW-Deltaproteobacteria-14]|jgi:small subunit ribosomal protein S7|nr:MAG: 30S ribosomal protein S7 [Deltaproteobacteria bacterium HGW-Deltaproteobacteria-14]
MPRKGEVPKRRINPDPKFKDTLVAKFVNVLMLDGKKAVAERIVYDAFDKMAERSGEDPVRVFKKALDNAKPQLEVKSRRVGGSNYQVPIEVRPNRKTALAMRWLIQYARSRGEKGMVLQLAGELLDAANNRGAAVKKKEDTHRMAEANKAFAHYRW